jgi:hypothetical protein
VSQQLEKPRVETPTQHGMVALEGQGEARRNFLLRRVDWRFLAGKPNPRLSLATRGSTLAQALELVSVQVLPLEEAAPGSADLAALTNPNQAELEQAWEALEPGGVLYGEWYLPRPAGPTAIRTRLSKLGFLPAGSYWPWPWPERATPAFWLPLDAPGALRHFLENRPPAQSLPARVLRFGLQSVWRLGHWSGMLAPVCTVAYKPLQAGSRHGFPPTSLEVRAARWLQQDDRGLSQDDRGMQWLLLTGGLHSTNKVTGLVFRHSEDHPSYVIKMPRREESLPSLQREAEVLQSLQVGRDSQLKGVPELVALDTSVEGGLPAIVETHLPGTPLYTAMQPERLEDLAHHATRWLLELILPGPPQPRDRWWERLVAPVLDDFERGYAILDVQPLVEAASRELARLGPLPLAVEHRDFSPWNIFVTRSGDLTVLDWEGAEPNGLPFTDLVYFLAYLAFFEEGSLEKGTTVQAYRRMLDPHTRLGSLAAGCMDEYRQKAGIPVESSRPLRLLTWLRHAVLERQLIEKSSSGSPNPQLLARGLHFSLVKTELEIVQDG